MRPAAAVAAQQLAGTRRRAAPEAAFARQQIDRACGIDRGRQHSAAARQVRRHVADRTVAAGNADMCRLLGEDRLAVDAGCRNDLRAFGLQRAGQRLQSTGREGARCRIEEKLDDRLRCHSYLGKAGWTKVDHLKPTIRISQRIPERACVSPSAHPRRACRSTVLLPPGRKEKAALRQLGETVRIQRTPFQMPISAPPEGRVRAPKPPVVRRSVRSGVPDPPRCRSRPGQRARPACSKRAAATSLRRS